MVRILQIAGFILFILGLTAGIEASGINDTYNADERSIPTLLLFTASGLFSGLVLVALGEILATLQGKR